MVMIVENIPKVGVYMYLFCTFGREYEPLGPIKIGITGNVRERLSSVQTGYPKPLEALAVFNTPNRDIARKWEAAFHKRYAGARLEGEWFNIDPVHVLDDVCGAIRHYFASGEKFASAGDSTPVELADYIGLPLFERDVKVYRAWREHYADNSNVTAMSKTA
jgi:hypothetical protein